MGSRGSCTGPRTAVHRMVSHHVWVSRGLGSLEPVSRELGGTGTEHLIPGAAGGAANTPDIPGRRQVPSGLYTRSLRVPWALWALRGGSQMPHPRAKAWKPQAAEARLSKHKLYFCDSLARLAWPVPAQRGPSGGLALRPHMTKQPSPGIHWRGTESEDDQIQGASEAFQTPGQARFLTGPLGTGCLLSGSPPGPAGLERGPGVGAAARNGHQQQGPKRCLEPQGTC